MSMRIAALIVLGVSLITGCSGSGTDPKDNPTTHAQQPGAQTPAATGGRGTNCIPSVTSQSARTRADLIGRSLSDVTSTETAAGHKVRVLGENGNCADRRDDYRNKRVNIVIQDGKVIWASMF